MKKVTDITGNIYARLTVIAFAYRKNLHTFWKCMCVCGKEIIAEGSHLKSGKTKSCGCWKIDAIKMSNTKHGLANKHRTYGIWKQMNARCSKPNNPSYLDYGGRGVTVCEEWKNNFKSFYDWSMENGYEKHLTIDRFPNNNGNYEPSNCRWGTMAEQNQNQRSTKLNPIKVRIIRNLHKMGAFTIKELSGIYGVTDSNIRYVVERKTWTQI